MTPLLRDILTGLVRFVLLWVIAFLGKHDIVITADATSIAEATAFVLGVIWIVWDKIKKHRLNNTRAALPEGATLQTAEKVVAGGAWASANTKANEVPVITQNKPITPDEGANQP